MRTIALVKNNIVINKIMAESLQSAPDVPCDAKYDVTGLPVCIGDAVPAGGYHAAGEVPATQTLPNLVITQVVADEGHSITHLAADFTEVTCPVGTTLTFTAELHLGGHVVPVSDAFRMPIRQRAGREGMLMANMVNGVVTVVAPFNVPGDDGAWYVDQATINASLPADKQMVFAGITVNVFRVPA